MILEAILNAWYALIEFLGSVTARPIEDREAEQS
jgi:hypothetical protein